jgi:hypothetical protein
MKLLANTSPIIIASTRHHLTPQLFIYDAIWKQRKLLKQRTNDTFLEYHCLNGCDASWISFHKINKENFDCTYRYYFIMNWYRLDDTKWFAKWANNK